MAKAKSKTDTPDEKAAAIAAQPDAPEPEVEETTEPEVVERRPLTPGQIVARKSADVHKSSSNEHVKEFVLPPGPKPTPANGYSHEANMAATVQYMISQGMRPAGDVRHVSTKQHPNGVSWVLTYAVPAIPAELEPEGTVTRVLELGESAEVNTSGAGHSHDTSEKVPNAPKAPKA